MTLKELDWAAVLGQQIRLYRNLNNGRMSVQSRQGTGWKVVGHVADCVIADVTMTVREAGRRRVIVERTKNVHAWVTGRLLGEADERIDATISLYYDPYQNPESEGHFYQRGTNRIITRCRYLVVRNNQVYVSADALMAVPVAFTPAAQRQSHQLRLNFAWMAPAAA